MESSTPSYGIIDVLFAIVKDTTNPNLSVFKQVMSLSDVDLNTKDNDGHTLVYYSISNGKFEITKFLFNSVKVEPTDVNTGFTNACQREYLETVKYVFANFNLDSDTVNTGFYYACSHGCVNVARYIAGNFNLNPNITTEKGDTCLMIHNLHPKICQILLEIGTDVNIKNNSGDTALIIAIYYKNVRIVKLLLQVPDIDVNIKNKDGDTALFKCLELNPDIEIVKLLLQVPSIDVNIKNKDGNTALLKCLEWARDIEIVKLLLQVPNININIKSSRGQTAIHFAVYREHFEICQLLLVMPQIDLTIEDEDGKSIFYYADVYCNDKRTKELLKKYKKSDSIFNITSKLFTTCGITNSYQPIATDHTKAE